MWIRAQRDGMDRVNQCFLGAEISLPEICRVDSEIRPERDKQDCNGKMTEARRRESAEREKEQEI